MINRIGRSRAVRTSCRIEGQSDRSFMGVKIHFCAHRQAIALAVHFKLGIRVELQISGRRVRNCSATAECCSAAMPNLSA